MQFEHLNIPIQSRALSSRDFFRIHARMLDASGGGDIRAKEENINESATSSSQEFYFISQRYFSPSSRPATQTEYPFRNVQCESASVFVQVRSFKKCHVSPLNLLLDGADCWTRCFMLADVYVNSLIMYINEANVQPDAYNETNPPY